MLLSLLTSPKLSKTAKIFNFLGTPARLYPLFSPISESLFRQLYLHANLTPVTFLVNHNYTTSTTIIKKVLLANTRLLQCVLVPLIYLDKKKSPTCLQTSFFCPTTLNWSTLSLLKKLLFLAMRFCSKTLPQAE